MRIIISKGGLCIFSLMLLVLAFPDVASAQRFSKEALPPGMSVPPPPMMQPGQLQQPPLVYQQPPPMYQQQPYQQQPYQQQPYQQQPPPMTQAGQMGARTCYTAVGITCTVQYPGPCGCYDNANNLYGGQAQ
jgi:hypothetical protein